MQNQASIEVSPDGTAIVSELSGKLLGIVKGEQLTQAQWQALALKLKTSGKVLEDFSPTQLTVAEADGTHSVSLDGVTEIHPFLCWQQLSFIQNKCRALGSYKDVATNYTGKSHVCTYARNFARNLYSAKSEQEEYTPVEKWGKDEGMSFPKREKKAKKSKISPEDLEA